MRKYVFKRYEFSYPKLYQSEKRELRKSFPKTEIEHIGSTAILGLGGKGIIDILIGVKKNQIKTTIKKLQEAGYIFKEKAGGRIGSFLRKIIRMEGRREEFISSLLHI